MSSACSGNGSATNLSREIIDIEVATTVGDPPAIGDFLSPSMQERLDQLVQSDVTVVLRPVSATRIGYYRSVEIESDGGVGLDWRRAHWAQTTTDSATVEEISASLLTTLQGLSKDAIAVEAGPPHFRRIAAADTHEVSVPAVIGYVELFAASVGTLPAEYQPLSELQFTLWHDENPAAFEQRPFWVQREFDTFVPAIGQLGLDFRSWSATVHPDHSSSRGLEPAELASNRGWSTVYLRFGRELDYASGEAPDAETYAALAGFAASFGAEIDQAGTGPIVEYLTYDDNLDRSIRIGFVARSTIEDSWMYVEIVDSFGIRPYELD